LVSLDKLIFRSGRLDVQLTAADS